MKYFFQRKIQNALYWIVRRLWSRLVYHCVIQAGVEVIKDNEVVPEVTYTDVLKRYGEKHGL